MYRHSHLHRSTNTSRGYEWSHSCNRVSGSSETKTYGKSAAVRAHEKQQTLPRRSFFGKDTTEILHIFNVLQTRFSPTEALFSGKLSYTDIARGCRHHCRKPAPLVESRSASS